MSTRKNPDLENLNGSVIIESRAGSTHLCPVLNSTHFNVPSSIKHGQTASGRGPPNVPDSKGPENVISKSSEVQDVFFRTAQPEESLTVRAVDARQVVSAKDVSPREAQLGRIEFKITSESVHKARASPNGSAESFWSHTMYERPVGNGSVQKVKVHYCLSKHTMEQVCKKYFLDEKTLGLDLEWSANASRLSGALANVSLIQLASPSHVGLFHVALFDRGELVAPTFRKIMVNPQITKVGVSIQADCTRLNQYLGIETHGLFELSHLYKQVKHSKAGRPDLINKRLVALATQVQEHFKLPMFKGKSVRASNWMRKLNEDQLICAYFLSFQIGRW